MWILATFIVILSNSQLCALLSSHLLTCPTFSSIPVFAKLNTSFTFFIFQSVLWFSSPKQLFHDTYLTLLLLRSMMVSVYPISWRYLKQSNFLLITQKLGWSNNKCADKYFWGIEKWIWNPAMEGCDVLLNFVYMQSNDSIKEFLFVNLDQQSESSIQQQRTSLGNKTETTYETGNNCQRWRSRLVPWMPTRVLAILTV